jgi:hypothetical protein
MVIEVLAYNLVNRALLAKYDGFYLLDVLQAMKSDDANYLQLN